MATMKSTGKNICDETYYGLADIKDRILELRDTIIGKYSGDRNVQGIYERHLNELIDQVDWRLQIMAHSCSYDWKGSDDYEENMVSVGPPEKKDEEFSPGYLGG